ncbi:transposase [Myxococcus llanfairpwllgwyngyllgogerychwyrndrobwllllantysiliogogogochensis]|uniref:Transposase n=1 Tax=Myxococcus llanfairpwllgwyngyllgogerychwyrndrobwllllantysiliogogogochensis TaxID=2590453 RepID=A0A540X0A2_9BACT|nr:transposase [Myxococcus llanfairpwllgwyngyllgogerychwyrndrobwllllantysiliogogogochensis]
MPYTDAFKAQMVKRMMGPSAVNASTLARQVGVSEPTLSQWLRAANRVAAMTPPSEEKKPAPSPVPKKWTPEEKLRVLAAAQELKGEELGALLRGEGLHEAQLREMAGRHPVLQPAPRLGRQCLLRGPLPHAEVPPQLPPAALCLRRGCARLGDALRGLVQHRAPTLRHPLRHA